MRLGRLAELHVPPTHPTPCKVNQLDAVKSSKSEASDEKIDAQIGCPLCRGNFIWNLDTIKPAVFSMAGIG